MSKINELTVFRESNATLRADCEAKTKRVSEMETKLQQVGAELGPAKQELLVAKAELEARDSQVSRLQEDNRRWQERNSQLMSKVYQGFIGSFDCLPDTL
jgi:nucleoprotein TPR